MSVSADKQVTTSEMSVWFEIGAKCMESLPVLHEVWNEVCSKSGFLPNNHVLGELRRLLRSSILLGQQVIYSSLCVTRYSRTEASNIYEDYVQYYIYDFIGRIKSSSDIFALLINHVYELGIDESKCLLERGPIVHRLDYGMANNDLAALINRARNEWLIPFYHMRNLVVHRAGLRFVIGGLGGCCLINIQLGEMLRVPEERRTIEAFLASIGVDVPTTCILDPVVLCEKLWDKWKDLAGAMMSSIKDKASAFLEANM